MNNELVYAIRGLLTFRGAHAAVFGLDAGVDSAVAAGADAGADAGANERGRGEDDEAPSGGGTPIADLTAGTALQYSTASAAAREVIEAVATLAQMPVSRVTILSVEEVIEGQATLSVEAKPFKSETLAKLAQDRLNEALASSEKGLALSAKHGSFQVYFGRPVEYAASVAAANSGNGVIDSTLNSDSSMATLDLVTIIAISIAAFVAVAVLIIACCIRQQSDDVHGYSASFSAGGGDLDLDSPPPQFGAGTRNGSPGAGGYMDPFDASSAKMSGVAALARPGHFYPGGSNWGAPQSPDEGYLVFHQKRSSISRNALDDAIMSGAPSAARADIHKVHSEVQNAVTGAAIGRSRSVKHASDWLQATHEEHGEKQRRWSSVGQMTHSNPFGKGQKALVTALTTFEVDALAEDIARLEEQQDLELQHRRNSARGSFSAPGSDLQQQPPQPQPRRGTAMALEVLEMPEMMTIFNPVNEEEFVLDQPKLNAFISSGLLNKLPGPLRQQVEGTIIKFPNRVFSEDEVMQLMPTLEAVDAAAGP